MSHKTPLVIANWKLNPGTVEEAKVLAQGVKKKLPKGLGATVVVAPPFLFIPEVAKVVKAAKSGGFRLGAQDVFWEDRGALTGEIGTPLLAAFGVSHIIIGHSERRALGETSEQVNKKIKAVLRHRLTPVVCIGEQTRDQAGDFFTHLTTQLKALASGLSATELGKVVIAYEPIWAIGTGATATGADVKEIQLFIVSVLSKLYDRKTAEKVTLLYGGSVKESNAKQLHLEGGMNGFLVGGASLDATQFTNIIKNIS